MYDRSLENTVSRRLWSAHNFEPKRMMLEFIQVNDDFARMAFKGLFDEEKPFAPRVERFVYYCDVLLENYQEAFPKKFENSHFHSYSTAIMYLAFRYPEKYGLYDFDIFRAFLQKVGAKNIPLTHDLERFPKVLAIVQKLLLKDDELLHLQQKRLGLYPNAYSGPSLLLATEFIEHLG